MKKDLLHFGGNLSSKGEGRLVEINGYEMDIAPGANVLVIRNMDVPGVVGTVGAVLGEEKSTLQPCSWVVKKLVKRQ